MITLDGYKELLLAGIMGPHTDKLVALLKADFNDVDQTLHWADVVEADFGGYARQNYSAQAIVPDLDANPWGRLVSGTFTFTAAGIGAAQNIYGIALITIRGAATILVAVNKFNPLQTLTVDGHKVERGLDFFDRQFTP